jgi:hypothetical protein
MLIIYISTAAIIIGGGLILASNLLAQKGRGRY